MLPEGCLGLPLFVISVGIRSSFVCYSAGGVLVGDEKDGPDLLVFLTDMGA